jgi:RNA polymerase sigma factor for flagellar operon FliA
MTTGSPALEERDALVMAHVGLVKMIALRLSSRLPSQVDLRDLMSVGVLGLLDAAGRYRATLGVPFDAFARRRIEGAMLDALRGLDWAPRSLRKLQREFEASIARLRHTLAREPQDHEIAADLELSPDAFARALDQIRALDLCTLKQIDGTTSDGVPLLELTMDPGGDPEVVLQRTELKQHLTAAIEQLPERERQILALYYDEELTLAEIGAVIGVCESRVSQLRSLALRRLRATLRSSLRLDQETTR